MQHLSASAFSLEPARKALENLISHPTALAASASAVSPKKPLHRQLLHTRLDLQEKEEELQRLERKLSAHSAKLQEKEKELSERWDAGRIYSIPISHIEANPHQPRRDFDDISLFSLANSIKEHGILQPLTIRRTPDQNNDEPRETSYQLIAGERRLRAASAIGMECVPCIILDADNRRAAELALIENLQRENLNLFEQAGAIAALIDMHAMTQEEIAQALSVSQSYIANKLRVLRLTEEERDIILTYHLTERHARAFLRIKDLELRRKTVRFIAQNACNVAQTEEYIDSLLSADTASVLRNKINKEPTKTSAPNLSAGQNKKCILKDLRLFFNTIDRAVSAAKEAGYSADCTRADTQNETVLTVIIRHPTSIQQNTDSNRRTTNDNPTESVSRETEIPPSNTNIR